MINAALKELIALYKDEVEKLSCILSMISFEIAKVADRRDDDEEANQTHENWMIALDKHESAKERMSKELDRISGGSEEDANKIQRNTPRR